MNPSIGGSQRSRPKYAMNPTNASCCIRVDLFDGPDLAVGNVFIRVGCGELHTVTG